MEPKIKKSQRRDKYRSKLVKNLEKNSLEYPPHPRKLHYQEYPIPPYSQEHLRSLLLEYMASRMFEYPIHHESIMAKIRSLYRSDQNNDIYMKGLNLPEVLAELHSQGCLKISRRTLGIKLVILVEQIFLPRVIEEANATVNLRPTVPPPDPITFQQQFKELGCRDQQKQKQIHQIVEMPSLLSGAVSVQDFLEDMQSYDQKLQLQESKKRKCIEFCDYCTRKNCQKIRGHPNCKERHFTILTNANTDESYGNCPHLNACHNHDCKLIHYLEENFNEDAAYEQALYRRRLERAEWINCDLRNFDFNIVGKFDVIMADPPWDIHMTLPYGTLKDKEMLNLKVDILQDNGVIFLWVTGRAMELGRECLTKWGYTYVDEIVWIKTNQVNRLIITGKTGHWLNHTKEHCLVGIKGRPLINTGLDCDVIASRVRETSRKPDQIYAMIERMHPAGKKIELFGRPDNCMPGWLTLGNQLYEVRLRDEDIIGRYKRAYPQQDLTEERMSKNLQQMIKQDNRNKVYNNHIQKNGGL